jgi:hypothetical protein
MATKKTRHEAHATSAAPGRAAPAAHAHGPPRAPARAKPAAPARPARPETALVRPVNALERVLEREGDRLWGIFRRRPYVGAVLAGGVGLALATAVGVAELAVAVGTGYAAFQVLKYSISPTQAVRETMKLEQGLDEPSHPAG